MHSLLWSFCLPIDTLLRVMFINFYFCGFRTWPTYWTNNNDARSVLWYFWVVILVSSETTLSFWYGNFSLKNGQKTGYLYLTLRIIYRVDVIRWFLVPPVNIPISVGQTPQSSLTKIPWSIWTYNPRSQTHPSKEWTITDGNQPLVVRSRREGDVRQRIYSDSLTVR